MKQNATTAQHIEVYRCNHCAGMACISIIQHTRKATWPEIEFCPFCGMSNSYPVESDGDDKLLLNQKNNR